MRFFSLVFLLAITLNLSGQTPNCDDANSYLVNAYSHVKDSYDSNNISHLKYFANRSVESFKLSKETLNNCGCKTALDLANKSMDLLMKVENAETFEDGRFFVKRARELSKESVIEIDKCSYANSSEETEALNENIDNSEETESTELNDLQKEQLKLKQQQEALKLKEAEIKQKLAQQKNKALLLKKEQLSLSYKKAIASTVKTYNETLKIHDGNHKYFTEKIEDIDLNSNSIEAIEMYYTNKLKTLAASYIKQLELYNK